MKHTTIIVVLMLLAATAAGQEPTQAQPPDLLPEFLKVSRIESITADMHDAASNRNVTFVVPRSCWEEITASLQPAKRSSERASGKVLGSLKIRYTDIGSQLAIELFDVPNGPGGFAIQENGGHMFYYRGGDSAKLKAAIQKARTSEK